jgi:hypothetical protein
MWRSIRNASVCLGLMVIAACEGPPGDENVQQTIVVLGEDGRQEVRTETVSRGQIDAAIKRRADRQARGWPPLAPDQLAILSFASCDDDRSMWLFDKPALDSTANKLCLIRDGGTPFAADDLSFFPRPGFGQHWGGKVRSFWAGSDPGYFRLGPSPYTGEVVAAGLRAETVSTTVRDSTVLALTEPGLKRSLLVAGWDLLSSSTCPRRTIFVHDGVAWRNFNVDGFLEQTLNGMRCRYNHVMDMVYTRFHTVQHVGGTCTIRAIEDSIVKTQNNNHEFLVLGEVSFYNGTCTGQHP